MFFRPFSFAVFCGLGGLVCLGACIWCLVGGNGELDGRNWERTEFRPTRRLVTTFRAGRTLLCIITITGSTASAFRHGSL